MIPYDTFLIAIWTPGDYQKIKKNEKNYFEEYQSMLRYFDSYIKMEFWDTEDNVPGYDTISEKQALELATVILANPDKKFVIHCDAGQSRSAGVALAVECILNYNGDRYQFGRSASFVSKPRYSPNRKVYDKIMDAYDKLKKG
jgi:predicted protein tyrosine phosphatase